MRIISVFSVFFFTSVALRSTYVVLGEKRHENWLGKTANGDDEVTCSRILVLAPVCSASHIFVYGPLVQALAERCHKVSYYQALELFRGPGLSRKSTALTYLLLGKDGGIKNSQ